MTGLVRIGAAAALALTAGCSSITGHKGFIADEVLIQSVLPGIDNQRSVEATLGRPSFVSQFGEPVWYYSASTTGQKPFTTPRIIEHTLLAIRFDEAGTVSSIDRNGMEQVARIRPDGDETPTLGRERTFLQDLFGNIGQVGAGAGQAGPGV